MFIFRCIWKHNDVMSSFEPYRNEVLIQATLQTGQKNIG